LEVAQTFPSLHTKPRLYKRGGADHPGLSKRVGPMQCFLMFVTIVTQLAMALAIAQHVPVLRGALERGT
jgi:hypothetical protein